MAMETKRWISIMWTEKINLNFALIIFYTLIYISYPTVSKSHSTTVVVPAIRIRELNFL